MRSLGSDAPKSKPRHADRKIESDCDFAAEKREGCQEPLEEQLFAQQLRQNLHRLDFTNLTIVLLKIP